MATYSYSQDQLEQIVAEYKRKRKNNPDSHIEHVKSLRNNFRDVIIAATVAIDGKGEKHIHQYRMSNPRLHKFARILCEHENSLRAAKNFDDLYNIISGIRIFGLGTVLYYDTALRIAHALGNLLPDKIYLMRGTLKGAQNLGVDISGKKHLERSELPVTLASSDLNCAELADLLCCYFAEGRWSDSLEFVN